jgi:hypothetical protein
LSTFSFVSSKNSISRYGSDGTSDSSTFSGVFETDVCDGCRNRVAGDDDTGFRGSLGIARETVDLLVPGEHLGVSASTEGVGDLLSSESKSVLDLGFERRLDSLVTLDVELVRFVGGLGGSREGTFGEEERESGSGGVGSVGGTTFVEVTRRSEDVVGFGVLLGETLLALEVTLAKRLSRGVVHSGEVDGRDGSGRSVGIDEVGRLLTDVL